MDADPNISYEKRGLCLGGQFRAMVGGMTVEAIKNAIAALPMEERHSLASWLNELEYDAWDKQMLKDFSPGGRGMRVVEKVKREVAEGNTVPLEKGLAQAKAKREPSRS